VLLFAYHLAWTLFVVFLLPFLPLLKNHRVVQRLVSDLPGRRIEGETIWIHALSVGEVLSALPLVEYLRKRFPGEKIAFTVTTRQGMEIARRELDSEVEILLPLPLDFWWSMLRVIRHVRPKLFILVETDLWPGLMQHLAVRGIPAVLVNGRVSPRTLKSYRRFHFFLRKVLERFAACLMQTELDSARLLKTGISSEKVRSLGNIKFDRAHTPMNENERRGWLEAFGLSDSDTVWLAGSTHRGEEKIIIEIFQQIRSSFPRLRLIIAPRRVERAEEVQRLVESKGLTVARKTAITNRPPPFDVLVLDTMGELGRVYGIACISFVGGSLVPEGGHNLLEPASFGCPVLFGPHTDDFKIMAEVLLEAGGGVRVHDAQQLSQAVGALLSYPEERARVGARARRFVDSNRGALERVMDEIAVFLCRRKRVIAHRERRE
jgi:3-deoxy-D-manno-octulosonic-acid transferase